MFIFWDCFSFIFFSTPILFNFGFCDTLLLSQYVCFQIDADFWYVSMMFLYNWFYVPNTIYIELLKTELNLKLSIFGIDDIIWVVVVTFLVCIFWVINLISLSKLLRFSFIIIVFIFVLLLFLTFIIWWDDPLMLSTVSIWSVFSAGYSNMSLYVLKVLLVNCLVLY